MKRAISSSLLLPALFLIGLADAAGGRTDKEDTSHDVRMEWFRDARFGCFMHWGVYSQLGNEWHGKHGPGYAEHIQRALKIAQADYRRDAIDKFNPTKFDAEAWVSLLERAGMRYYIITAKHHDGFAMYDSKVSDYNVVKATPWHRDPMKELKAASQKHGLHFGFYYSHAFDWGDQYGPGNDWEWKNPGGDRLLGGKDWWASMPEKLADVRKNYVDRKSIPQIRELIANYQPDILWFDTPHKLPFEENLRILQAVREAGPKVVINGRLARDGARNYGDYLSTGDRAVEFVDRKDDWEAIPTTNESYGWNPFDLSHKSPEFLIRVLAKAVSRGGNLLLNVGPMGDGRIDPKDAAILEGIGRWMNVNGEAIHGCGRSALPVQSWGVVTARKKMLYLHVFGAGEGPLIVGGLLSTPIKAWLLADDVKSGLKFHRINDRDLAMDVVHAKRSSEIDIVEQNTNAAPPAPLPGHRVHRVAGEGSASDTVIALEFDDVPKSGGVRLLSNAGETNQLLAFDAQRHRGDQTGDASRLSYGDGKKNRYYVGGWKETKQWLDWEFRLNEPAKFDVNLRYAKGSGGGKYALRCGTWEAAGLATRQGRRDEIVDEKLGKLDLPAGTHRIELRAAEVGQGELFLPLELQLRPSK